MKIFGLLWAQVTSDDSGFTGGNMAWSAGWQLPRMGVILDAWGFFQGDAWVTTLMWALNGSYNLIQLLYLKYPGTVLVSKPEMMNWCPLAKRCLVTDWWRHAICKHVNLPPLWNNSSSGKKRNIYTTATQYSMGKRIEGSPTVSQVQNQW